MKNHIATIFFIFITTFVTAQIKADDSLSFVRKNPSDTYHTLTIYLIPSAAKYDWSSPHDLFRTYKKNYFKNVFKKDSYILGHAFIEIQSPLLNDHILTGMRAAGREEQRQLVLKEHYGLTILGIGLQGRLEFKGDLEKEIEKYSRKGNLAFIRIYIGDETVARLLYFLNGYKERLDSLGNPGPWYGGAFYPRYYGEGSGCSAFVISFMDLCGVLNEEFDRWHIDVNIPMDLMGGPINGNHEVRLQDIRKCKQWASDTAKAGIDYTSFRIYDPTLIYDWVVEKYDQPVLSVNLPVEPVTINKSKGIEIDAREIPVPREDIFTHRDIPTIFIEFFNQENFKK